MIELPRLVIKMDRFKKNLRAMKAKADKNNLDFRPHFKTHQSISLGRIFKESGIDAITVSSVDMAAYFAEAGWKDITIAFPSPIHKIDLINDVSKNCELKLILSSKDAVEYLSKNLKSNLNVYLEINSGQNRSGVTVNDIKSIKMITDLIKGSNNLKFYGFYCHAGQTYSSNSVEEIMDSGLKVINKLSSLKQDYPNAEICFGDTPSCSVLEEFGEVTQLSPGNFIFYDWMQYNIGSCSDKDIAVAVECPVVEKNEERKQLVIHGGAIHFSKDFIFQDSTKIFGQVCDSEWEPIKGSTLIAISQEHGIVQCSEDHFDSVDIGDSIFVLPIHSCLTANLMAEYTDIQNNTKYDHKQKRPV